MSTNSTLLSQLTQKVEEMMQRYRSLEAENSTLIEDAKMAHDQSEKLQAELNSLRAELVAKDEEVEAIVAKIEGLLGS